MISLFHSGAFSNRISKTSVSSSSLTTRTVPGTEKEMNTSVVRRDIQFSPGLLLDYTLFSYILAVDAVLTAEVFFRDRLQTKNSLSA
ncbi:MAG: hypothetical protein Q3M30_10630 [Candidatus Electrothrix sp. Rat3]|nr:hypothetical protein [Candidatus Electrothrix rattekaaiensis]